MATLLEIRSLFGNDSLRGKVQAAVIIAAEKIRTEDAQIVDHAKRMTWAKQAFNNPIGISSQVLMAVIAANNSATVAQIIGASDATIQAAVENSINIFLTE
jgi:predicted house-cleaning NTP pyrophosphatase (Maf/HAM1 superfamily)